MRKHWTRKAGARNWTAWDLASARGKTHGYSMWPDIPYPPWRETCTALHLYSQIIGKYRVARAPWMNHSWHATLDVNGRGLTTSLVPDGSGGVELALDLIDHAVVGTATDGRTGRFSL